MLYLLLLSFTARAAPSPDVRRVEVIAGEPWLVGATASPSEGPWAGHTLSEGISAWVGPSVAADPKLVVGGAWQVGASSCTVDRLNAVTAGYIDADPTEPLSADPQCGTPMTWAHLRCDAPVSAAFAVPQGAKPVVIATNEGPVERPDVAALVHNRPSWQQHRAPIEAAATAHPLSDGSTPVAETVQVTRYSSGAQAWLLVDSEIMWGEGYAPCSGEGGTSRALTVLTDTATPTVVSQVWRDDSAWVMNLLRIDGLPTLHMAITGTEYLGADTETVLYSAGVCVCMC